MIVQRVQLPHNWRLRPYQEAAWGAFEAGIKRQLLVWHRRAGKDEIALHKIAVSAHQRIGNYWHCLPKYEQARKAIWEAVNPHTGIRRIDEAFPHECRARTDNTSMVIEFHTGSTYRIVGSDNPDSLVGSTPVGIVFSEWALSNPSAWAYLAPALAENGGWADFITTPRGKNHVWKMLQTTKNDPAWFTQVLTVAETGFPLAVVEEQRREYHGLYGAEIGDALIQQEYYCSFNAATLGSFYGAALDALEREGRLVDGIYTPELLVHTAWDLGIGDSTAIWCFQAVGNELRVIDYYENHGQGLEHYVGWLNNRPYRYGQDWLPHDARVRELGTGRTRVETLQSMGRKCSLVPAHKIGDGINAFRVSVPHMWFERSTCTKPMEYLKQYHAEWDDEKQAYGDKPVHDYTSHCADAARYMALAWREMAQVTETKPKPRFLHEVTANEVFFPRQESGFRGVERI